MSTFRPFDDQPLDDAPSGLSIEPPQLLSMPPERATVQHYYGDTYNKTNIHNAPVTTINHAENVYQVAEDDLLLFESLPKQPDLSGQWSEYLRNSRNGDMQEIWRWIDSRDSNELVFWIHGPAGLGKSTLARELMHDLLSRGRLAGAIFLSQLPTDSWGPETVIRLIGAEIGRIHRRAIPTIAEAVRKCHNRTLDLQVRMFILEPLSFLEMTQPLVVIVDAIDEWRLHHNFIEALAYLGPYCSLIRFVILGRLEPRARRFQNVCIRPYHLRPVSVEVMKAYIDHRFQRIDWEFGRKPVEQDILRLVDLADGLFVWIATVCSLLERRSISPWSTLTDILHSRRNIGESNGLVRLYHSAIMLLFPDPEDRHALKDFLGFAMILQEPLTLDNFVHLTGLNHHTTLNILSDLRALQIRRPNDSRTMVHPASTTFHMSLIEYLQSPSTPAEVAFSIQSTPYHSRLGGASLQAVMNLPIALPAANGSGLPSARRYAMLFWMWHITKGTPLIEPYSNTDWEETSHSVLLRGRDTYMRLSQWAGPFVKHIQPNFPWTPPADADVSSLMQSVASSLDLTVDIATIFKIPCLEIAVRVAPNDLHGWIRLSVAYDNLVRVTDLAEFVTENIAIHQHAADISRQTQGSDYESHMLSLANSIFIRAQRSRTREDLETSIHIQREVLSTCPLGHASRPRCCMELANSLYTRYEWTGSVADVDEAIPLHQEGIELLPPDEWEGLSLALSSLAVCFNARYETSGSIGYLAEAIFLQREAMTLLPSGSKYCNCITSNLAQLIYTRYKEIGQTDDAEEAVSLGKRALKHSPPGHPDRPTYLSNLSLVLQDQCEDSGFSGDLEEVVCLERELMALQATGHPDRVDTLGCLASSLSRRFDRLGAIEDLEETISLRREVLALKSSDGQVRSTALDKLISSLHTHFKVAGSADSLDELITLGRELLSLRPWDLNPLRNQSGYLYKRFVLKGAVEDLTEALALTEKALPLCSPDGAEREELSDRISSHKAELSRLGLLSWTFSRVVSETPVQGHPEGTANEPSIQWHQGRVTPRRTRFGASRSGTMPCLIRSPVNIASLPLGHFDR